MVGSAGGRPGENPSPPLVLFPQLQQNSCLGIQTNYNYVKVCPPNAAPQAPLLPRGGGGAMGQF